jgi:phage gp29-like protein
MASVPDLAMLGSTGAQADIDRGDVLPQLRGERWHRTVREMTETDPIISAIMFAIEMMIRRVDWTIAPASDDPEDVDIATFVDECLFQDLDPEWEDTLSEILSFLSYGWSFFEVIYKRRGGETGDPATSSHFNDGKIGWRSWSIRPQETLGEWRFRDDGTVEAMVQVAPPKYVPVTIPLDKALLFRSTSRHGSPQGRSILRSAYQAWYYKREIQKFEAIGIERDLAGVPVAWAPAEFMSANATPEQKHVIAGIQRIVTNLRRNQQEGVVMPMVYDSQGNKLYDLELLSSGGARQIDTGRIIERYDTRIAMSVLADFITVGHERVGTYSLASSKTDLFVTALEAWLDAIAAVINEQAIHRLLRYNGMPVERAPRLVPGKVMPENLEALGSYLKTLSDAGVLDVTPELRTHVLRVAGLPVPQETGE